MHSLLPPAPFNGQVFIDATSTQWIWDATAWVWKRSGAVGQLPLATDSTSGLMSPIDKAILDRIPPASGAFGITISTPLTLTGDITLTSESLDFVPVDRNGRQPSSGRFVSADTTDPALMGGFQVSLSNKFLESFCMEIVSFPGGDGPIGDAGEPGLDGFNDGPRGTPGVAGTDAITASNFSGIKLIELDEIVKRAVVDVGLDPLTATLTVHHGNVQVANTDTPADQLIIEPVSRHLIYSINSEVACRTTLDDWRLSVPNEDSLPTEADLYVFKLPATVTAGSESTMEITRLSDLIQAIVDIYKAQLDAFDKQWQLDAKAFIEAKDSTAREVLSDLAEKLAECEFARPIQFSLGVDAPSADSGGGGGGGGSGAPRPELQRTLIISIMDESIYGLDPGYGYYYEPVYTRNTSGIITAISGYTPLSQANYTSDKVAWESKMNDVVGQGWHVRCGLIQPYVQYTTFPPNQPLDYLRCPIIDWPIHTDGKITPANAPSALASGGARVTADAIMATYDNLTNGGTYVPTLVAFVLDNSGSMVISRDYGGPPALGEMDPPTLKDAKDRIRAKAPGVTILSNTIGDRQERWINQCLSALNNLISTGGL